MASAVYGSGGVYGFLGFSQGPHSGFLIPAWGASGYFFTAPSGFASGYSSGASGFGPLLPVSINGNSGAAAFTNGIAFEFPVSGTQSLNQFYLSGYPLPFGYPYIFEAALPFGATGYFIDSLGSVSAIYSGGAVSAITGTGIPVNAPIHATSPAISGTLAYLTAGISGIAVYDFSGPSATLIAPSSGFNAVLCCCLNGSGIPYAGVSAQAAFSSKAIAAAASPGNPSYLATICPNLSGGTLQIWSGFVGIPGPTFNFLTQATGFGFTSSVGVSWPSTTGMIVMDSGSGILTPFSYIAGNLSPGTPLTGITGTFPSIAIYNGVSALIPQRSTSGVLLFTLTGSNWALAGSGNISGVTGINIGPLAISNGILAVPYGGAFSPGTISFLIPNASGVWNSIGSAATSLQVVALSVDQAGNFFGSASGLTYLYSATNPPNFIASAALGYPGAPIGNASYNLQYFTATSSVITTQDLYSKDATINTLDTSGQTAWFLNTGPTGVAFQNINNNFTFHSFLFYNGTLLAPSQNQGIAEFYLSQPFFPQGVAAGGVGFYSGGVWSAISGFPQGSVPEAITFDLSGNIRFACLDGTSFAIAAGTSTVSAQTVWTQGGGLLGISYTLSGGFKKNLYGAAALAPAVVGWQ